MFSRLSMMSSIYFRSIQCFKAVYSRNNLCTSQFRTISFKNPCNSTKTIVNEPINDTEDPDKPVEYLKSDAARWKASVSRSGGDKEMGLWYQPYVISISLSIFLIYFCILREESDVDMEFSKDLYDRISGLEEKNLEIVLKYNKENNIATSDIETRLKEIQSEQK